MPSQQCCKIAATTTHQQSLTHSLPASLSQRSCLWVWPSYFFYIPLLLLLGCWQLKKNNKIPSFIFSLLLMIMITKQIKSKILMTTQKKYTINNKWICIIDWPLYRFFLCMCSCGGGEWPWPVMRVPKEKKILAVFFYLCLEFRERGDCLVWTQTQHSLQLHY